MNAHRTADPNKIVFVNRYFFPDQSATSQLLSDLSVDLARRGLSIHVICSRQRYDQADARLPATESIEGVTVHRVWSTSFGRDRLAGRAIDYASFYVTALFGLLRVLRHGDTVVAKTDPPLISIVALLATTLKRAHLINWLQDIFPEVASKLGANPLPGWLNQLLQRVRDASLNAARVNVVLGARMRELLEQRRVAADKIVVIENWADGGETQPLSTQGSLLRARLGLANKFVVAYSGNLGRAHEFQTLLDAAAILQPDRDIVFLMIGGGAGMPLLQRAVLQNGLDNFRFLGYQPRASLSDSLAAADAHLVSLLPALEGLIVPSKFYGILAAGRAAIFVGDADGELARVIQAERVGAVAAVGDAAGLARHIATLKSDPAQCRLLGDTAFQLYSARYSAPRALQRWADLLNPAGLGLAIDHRPSDPAFTQAP